MARRQLGQLLAYLSKFPTLLFYKMMGITPLIFYFADWIDTNLVAKLLIIFEISAILASKNQHFLQ